ncbi:MAG: hypothetical protein KTR32_02865 [Granulosicoccus sp.]|nr:hypothetical protein [Granulosicoccus sp.]
MATKSTDIPMLFVNEDTQLSSDTFVTLKHWPRRFRKACSHCLPYLSTSQRFEDELIKQSLQLDQTADDSDGMSFEKMLEIRDMCQRRN